MPDHYYVPDSCTRACSRFSALLLPLLVFTSVAPLCQAAAASPAIAPADPPQQSKADTTTLDTVQVTGERYDARKEDTASRTTVDRAQLTRFGDTRLADALKRQPGVVVSEGAPGGGGTISLRGLAGGYTQILLDGQPAPAGFDIGALSPALVERVDILRTTTADLRGEAIAGTINIILGKSARTNTDELAIGLGSNNGQWQPTASWTRSRRDEHGGRRLAIAAGRREFLVEEAGTETGVGPAGESSLLRSTALHVEGHRDSLAVSSGLNRTLVNGASAALNVFYDASSYDKHTSIRWDTQMGEGLEHVRYRQFTGIEVAQLRTDATWTQPFEHAGTLTAKVSIGGNREQFRFRERGYDLEDALNLNDITDARLRVANTATTGKHAFPVRGAHTMELGWDASDDRRYERRSQTLAAFGDKPRTVSDLSFDTRVRRIAAFVQDDWSVLPGWALYLGGRWERIDTMTEGSGIAHSQAAWSIFSPIVQSLWKPPSAADDRLRIGLGRTYRAPSPRALSARPYTSTNNRPLNPDHRGNPGLRPELALGLDLTYERFWDKNALVSIGMYAKDIDHLILDETRQIHGRWVSTPVNGGRARVLGVEFEARSPLRRWWAEAPDLELRFSAGRRWSSVDGVPGPDDRIPGQPAFIATAAADWTGDGSWSAGGSFGYRSGGAVQANAFEVRRSSPQGDLDLYMRRRISPRSTLRISVADAFSRDDASIVTYQTDQGRLTMERNRTPHPRFRLAWELQL